MNAAPTLDSDLYALWSAGELWWLLHDDQMRVYRQYREWERQDPTTGAGLYRRVFVLDIGRRWGKTTLIFVIKMEDCIRQARSAHRYSTAFQKDIEEILDDVSRYVLETCPEPLRPQYRLGHGPRPAGWYFPNGSVMKTVGLDKNPEGLRGRSSDGEAISEAAFVKHLRHNIKSVLYPQFQGRPHARMILESSGPEDPDTEYDEVFVSDAQERGAYVYRTIEDNPRLSRAEKDEFIQAAGGRGDPDCEREYFNIRVRDPKTMLVPEFDKHSHVQHVEPPQYRDCVVSLDPGVSHLCALVFGYWDFERACGVIERSWAQQNANTEKVAGVIRSTERELWGKTVRSWRAGKLVPAPFVRVSDTDARMLLDLKDLHKIQFIPTLKDNAEAALHALRIAFKRGQLVILPEGNEQLIAHLNAGKWAENGKVWATHEKYGHFDLIAALVYWWRKVHEIRSRNPVPPSTYGVDHKEAMILKPPGGRDKTARTLSEAFGGKHGRTARTRRR